MKKENKRLSQNQYKAIELLAFEGLTQREVATKLGLHENTITNWKKDEVFIAELHKASTKSLNAASAKALSTMLGLLNAESETVQFNAAKDILDRSGLKSSDNINLGVSEKNDKLGSILDQLKNHKKMSR